MYWAGGEETYLNQPDVITSGRMVLGRYGGCTTAGARANEDAAFLRDDPAGHWEIAAVADGHAGAASSALAVRLLDGDELLPQILGRPTPDALAVLHAHLVTLFQAADTTSAAGETAVLVVARWNRYVYWLSVGDCLAYVLHPELSAFGQYALNQRSFYEWFGKVNSLRLDVPCFATGVHALRPGRSRITLATDGLLEFESSPYGDGARLYRVLATGDIGTKTAQLVQTVHDAQGKDSATVVSWDVHAGDSPMQPSS
jgi:serine/threonine protein phosphatase PrpC